MDDDVSLWLEQLTHGDPEAVQKIWESFYPQLVHLAQRKLAGLRHPAADGEDVALSALDSFFRGAAAGRFPALHDGDGLWKLLLTITTRKALVQKRRELAGKRGCGKLRGESVFLTRSSQSGLGINGIACQEPTPALVALVGEEVDRLLRQLSDSSLREIALLKLDGYTNEEIAEKLDYSLRRVERKLALIRSQWEGEVAVGAGFSG